MEEKKEKLLDQARKDAHVIIEEGKKQAKEEEKGNNCESAYGC